MLTRCRSCHKETKNFSYFVKKDKTLCFSCYSRDYDNCFSCWDDYLKNRLVKYRNELYCRKCLFEIYKEVKEKIKYLDSLKKK